MQLVPVMSKSTSTSNIEEEPEAVFQTQITV